MAGVRIKDLTGIATALAETDFLACDADGFNSAKKVARSVLGTHADNTLYVSGTNGDNNSAIAGRTDRPYQTIQAALAAQVAGQCVHVYPGTYNLTAALAAVDNGPIWLDPGVTIAPSNCFAFDISTGITVLVYGQGDIVAVDGSGGAGSIAGALRVNHASAVVKLNAHKLRCTQTNSNDSSAAAVIKQTLANRCVISAEEISSDGDSCIWWEQGDLDIQARRICFDSGNAISQNPVIYSTNSAANNKCWITADEIFSDNTQTAALWLGDGSNATSAIWIDAQEIRSSGGSQFRTVNLYSGKTYIRAMKVFANSSTGYGIWTQASGSGLYYLDIQKIEAVIGINLNSGSSWIKVGEFNDSGFSGCAAITVGGGSHNVQLQTAIGTAAPFANGFVSHQGGTLNLQGAYIKPLNGANSYPVVVSSSGLTLRNCLLIAPATPSYSINAGSAQTVQLVGCAANKTTNNITVKGAALTVDAALT